MVKAIRKGRKRLGMKERIRQKKITELRLKKNQVRLNDIERRIKDSTASIDNAKALIECLDKSDRSTRRLADGLMKDVINEESHKSIQLIKQKNIYLDYDGQHRIGRRSRNNIITNSKFNVNIKRNNRKKRPKRIDDSFSLCVDVLQERHTNMMIMDECDNQGMEAIELGDYDNEKNEGEVYVLEELVNGKRRRRRRKFRANGARGNNVIEAYDEEDIYLESNYTNNRYPFAEDLKRKDKESIDFDKQWLVGIEFNSAEFSCLSWTELRSLSSNHVRRAFNKCKIVLCKRNDNGQFYVAQGFRDMVHFSIGPEAKKQLSKFFNDHQVEYHELKGINSNENQPPWFRVTSRSTKSNRDIGFMETIDSHMNNIASVFIPELIKNPINCAGERVKCSINLGLTDQKCDQYEMMSTVRNIKPSLISLKTSKRDITTEMLKDVVAIILFVLRECPSHFNLPESSNNDANTSPSNELFRLFAKQLGLYHEDDLHHFRHIGGIAFLLSNSGLNPHKDEMNPRGRKDITIQFNIPYIISKLSPGVQVMVKDKFGSSIDRLFFSMICYPRKCVDAFERRMNKIHSFPQFNTKEEAGRRKLIQLFMDAGSTYDFNSRCFTKGGYKKRRMEVIADKDNDGFSSSDAAIDKMSWWSPIIHCFLLFVSKFGISQRQTVEILLFFAHQCNTTVVFTKAFLSILQRDPNKKWNKSMYHYLCVACFVEKNGVQDNMNLEIKQKKDIGSGKYQRFQPSCTDVFTEIEVNSKVDLILDLIDHYTSCNITSLSDKEKLVLIGEFTTQLDKGIKGIRVLRGQMIVQLCALFGLLPLDFYTHIPMHVSGGGPKAFMLNLMKWNESDSILDWNISIVKELQALFNNELTYNMFENATCEIGRSGRAEDVFFILPKLTYIQEGTDYDGTDTCSDLQLFFRIEGNRNSEWCLQAYAGGNKKVIVFCDNKQKHKKNPLVEWKRSKRTGFILRESKLKFENGATKVLQDLYTN